jgi:hypothetical protein
MDDTEKKLQQELRDDVKALNAQVSTMNAQLGVFIERSQHDISLVKRAMFGSDNSIGLVREVDGIRRDLNDISEEIKPHPPRDLNGRVAVLEAARAETRADRRKLFMTFLTTMVVGATGWLVAVIQQFIRP